MFAGIFLSFIPFITSGQGIISGIVQDSENGEAVIGANVNLIGTKRGATTNRFGFFAIADLDINIYKVRVTSIGFLTDTIAVHITSDQREMRLNIKLKSQAFAMEAITIEADREKENAKKISAVEVPIEQLIRMPSLGGESDIFRSLQLLPGVKASSELSSGLYIRGGSPDQNLVLLDRMILYNPTHLGGFLSTFNSDAINHVTLVKGAMPAEYGGRLSSVIDVTMREGSNEGFHGRGGVSMIDSRLTLEGPITEGSTFMISGRRVYLDWLVKLFSDETLNYYFYDLVAKTNLKLGANDRFYFSGFFGRDVMGDMEDKDEPFDISWGNSAGNLRWTHIFENKLFTNVSAIVSDYRFTTNITEHNYSDQNTSTIFKSVSGILDYNIRGEAEYFASSDHTIKMGLETIVHTFTSEASSDINEVNEFKPNLPTYRGTEISLYVQDEWNINERFRTNLGGRAFYFDRGKYFRFEPRLAAFYTLDDGTTLKAAFAGANQFLHLVSRNDLSLPTDMWFPSTSSIKPAYSLQYVLGASRDLFDGEYNCSLEGYYKSMYNLLEFKDNAVFSIFAPLENELTSGWGRGYGIELFFQKRKGAFTGWIGYTLSWTDRTFPELNNGMTFPPRYDQRHDISLVLNYKIGESWDFTATWVYATGQAFTFTVAQYQIYYPGYDGYDDPRLYYSDRNGYRLPSYHRLDLNFTHAFHWFGWDWKASINVYNAYSHKNPFLQEVRRTYDSPTSSWEINQVTLFPFLPTFGISFSF